MNSYSKNVWHTANNKINLNVHPLLMILCTAYARGQIWGTHNLPIDKPSGKHGETLPQIYEYFVNGSAVNFSWWRHQMETFSALLAICAGNSPVPGEFPTQRPVTRSFDVYFDLRPDNRLSKQSWGWWFETLSHSLWRRRNVLHMRNADILRNMHTFLVWLVLYWWQHYAW